MRLDDLYIGESGALAADLLDRGLLGSARVYIDAASGRRARGPTLITSFRLALS